MARVNIKDLSEEQMDDAIKMGRKVDDSATQLVTTHRQDHETTDFVTSIIYMLVNSSCYIKDILACISYKHDQVLTEYLDYLENQRKGSCCPLMSRTVKNLANTIPGQEKTIT